MNSWNIQHLASCQWKIRLSSWPPIFNRYCLA